MMMSLTDLFDLPYSWVWITFLPFVPYYHRRPSQTSLTYRTLECGSPSYRSSLIIIDVSHRPLWPTVLLSVDHLPTVHPLLSTTSITDLFDLPYSWVWITFLPFVPCYHQRPSQTSLTYRTLECGSPSYRSSLIIINVHHRPLCSSSLNLVHVPLTTKAHSSLQFLQLELCSTKHKTIIVNWLL